MSTPSICAGSLFLAIFSIRLNMIHNFSFTNGDGDVASVTSNV